jgi:hypothetical protein
LPGNTVRKFTERVHLFLFSAVHLILPDALNEKHQLDSILFRQIFGSPSCNASFLIPGVALPETKIKSALSFAARAIFNGATSMKPGTLQSERMRSTLP